MITDFYGPNRTKQERLAVRIMMQEVERLRAMPLSRFDTFRVDDFYRLHMEATPAVVFECRMDKDNPFQGSVCFQAWVRRLRTDHPIVSCTFYRNE